MESEKAVFSPADRINELNEVDKVRVVVTGACVLNIDFGYRM